MSENLPEQIGIKIAVVAVGGAGLRVLDRMQLEDAEQLRLIAIDAHAQTLNNSQVARKVLVGRKLTRGMGTGGDIERGRDAAMQDRQALEETLEGFDLVFLLVGLGGGSGSGVAPVVAEIASDQGSVVIVFGTQPFAFEGKKRNDDAAAAAGRLRDVSHAVISLPNDLLVQPDCDEQSVLNALGMADAWMERGVRAISAMVTRPGLISQDFAALQRVLSTLSNKSLFGLGVGEGSDAVDQALRQLRQCPLLQTPEGMHRAEKLIVNITGGSDLTMADVHRIVNAVNEVFISREDTVFGANIDESVREMVEICVLGVSNMGHEAVALDVQRTSAAVMPPRAPSKPKQPLDPVIPVEQPREKRAKKSKPVVRVHRSKLGPKQADLLEQEEFLFLANDEQRGIFEDTEPNEYAGEDLDVPTFLRRGVKVALK
ncbi:MAG: cell division FtsZ family protein [Opitutales bacterium]|nr:cell division FtsZ family protein [Opitutales bacterium]